MADWWTTFDPYLWLKDDETGEGEAPFILRALGLQPGDRVLDAPCGAGRISVPLARLGCRVAGIDLMPAHVARAKQRLKREGLTGDYTVGDLRDLDANGVYDAAFNWGGSFGYFTNRVNADVLARLARALRPGGRLLIDQPNRENVLRHFLTWVAGEDITLYSRWDARTQRIETTWTIHDPDGDRVSVSSMRLYTPGQLRRLFARAGLRWEAAYGGADGSPFRRASRRMIVVAVRDDR